jgi:hypothetical protein
MVLTAWVAEVRPARSRSVASRGVGKTARYLAALQEPCLIGRVHKSWLGFSAITVFVVVLILLQQW